MAQQLNVTRSGPADLLDNMPAAGLMDYTDATREFKPAYERPDWRVEAVRAGVLLVSLTVAWALWGLWKTSYCWGGRNWQACAALAWWEPLGALLAVLVVVGLPAWRVTLWGMGEWRLAQARAARVATTFTRWGDPQRMDQPLSLAVEMERYRLATELKARTAPYETLHSINTYSPSFQQPKEAAALPAPANAPPVGLDTWLGWVNDPDGEPHLMISGKTKAGKSTVAEALLSARVARGDDVFIIDPHYQPVNKYGETTWCGLRGVGGDGWHTVKGALAAVRGEYERRKLAANQGEMPPGGFTPLTIIIDEAPEIYEEITREWESFQGVMGSGARKYSIYLIVITQSHFIKDIGGSTAKRENFAIVALNEKAKRLIEDEVYDHQEKAALIESLKGQPWPAAMLRQGEVCLLDRAGIRERRPARLNVALWQPCAPVAPPPDALLELLRGLRAAGWSRQAARDAGLQFDNDLWAAAGE